MAPTKITGTDEAKYIVIQLMRFGIFTKIIEYFLPIRSTKNMDKILPIGSAKFNILPIENKEVICICNSIGHYRLILNLDNLQHRQKAK